MYPKNKATIKPSKSFKFRNNFQFTSPEVPQNLSRNETIIVKIKRSLRVRKRLNKWIIYCKKCHSFSSFPPSKHCGNQLHCFWQETPYPWIPWSSTKSGILQKENKFFPNIFFNFSKVCLGSVTRTPTMTLNVLVILPRYLLSRKRFSISLSLILCQ